MHSHQDRETQSSRRRHSRWHTAGRAFAIAMRMLPRTCRYPVARGLARLLEPLIARTEVGRDQLQRRFDGVREVALYAVLRVLAQEEVPFDANLPIEGVQHLHEAASNGRGLLLIGAHTMLTSLIVRTLHPLGVSPLIVAVGPEEKMPGNIKAPRRIQPSAKFLLTVRSELQAGGTVCALIDQERPTGERIIRVQTALGPVFITDGLIRVACRCRAQIFFMSVRFDRHGELRGFVNATACPIPTVEQATADVIRFVQQHMSARCAGRADALRMGALQTPDAPTSPN